ncbi:hypothetical protein VTP01DRAFT_4991 [Rhizomucor pusillus]|uniref:uncharacterized protein n=1 Tax=Rhizomucor pusillus TaxID=4840 RepID=UPI0037448EEB
MLGSAIALVSLLLTLSVSASPVAPVVHGGDLTYNNGLKDVSHSKLDARNIRFSILNDLKKRQQEEDDNALQTGPESPDTGNTLEVPEDGAASDPEETAPEAPAATTSEQQQKQDVTSDAPAETPQNTTSTVPGTPAGNTTTAVGPNGAAAQVPAGQNTTQDSTTAIRPPSGSGIILDPEDEDEADEEEVDEDEDGEEHAHEMMVNAHDGHEHAHEMEVNSHEGREHAHEMEVNAHDGKEHEHEMAVNARKEALEQKELEQETKLLQSDVFDPFQDIEEYDPEEPFEKRDSSLMRRRLTRRCPFHDQQRKDKKDKDDKDEKDNDDQGTVFKVQRCGGGGGPRKFDATKEAGEEDKEDDDDDKKEADDDLQ